MDKLGKTDGFGPDAILYTGSREELQRKLRTRDDEITRLQKENEDLKEENARCWDLLERANKLLSDANNLIRK